MKRLRWFAITSTTISALALFFISNTELALRPLEPDGSRPACVLLFEFPFTDYSFQLPFWMWGLVPFSALVLSALTAVASWAMLLFRRRAMTRLGGGGKLEVKLPTRLTGHDVGS
jgi:hypothetical protein